MATVFKRGGKKAKGYWYASWTDHVGKRRTKCTRTTDKATAERIAHKHESDAALRRDGVIDPTLDTINTESQRSIESHLADYESKLRAANRTDKYIADTVGFIRAICDRAGYQVASDIKADGVNNYAGWLKDNGKSARTVQAYLTAIKGLTKWLTEHQKLPRDPLASVKKPNPKTARRYERRMLLPEEWPRLAAATEAGPIRYGMTGAERLLLYRVAIQTGLRAGELRSLNRARLVCDDSAPYVTCKAGSTKNRELARQYIQPDLATDLRSHIARKAPKTPIFSMPPDTKLAKMIRADLADARQRWIKEARNDPDEHGRRGESDFLADQNHDGEVFDFHSLRHTCGAWLALTGAHPKVIQTVMRHSSITLTMDTYGHLIRGQEADAVGRMHDMMDGPPQALAATGTDDAAAEGRQISAAPGAARRMRNRACTMRRGATKKWQEADEPDDGNDRPKVLPLTNLDDSVRPAATGGDKRRARDSNPQPVNRQLISNQPPHQFGYPPVAASHRWLATWLS